MSGGSGAFVCVVGPSGAGKDALIAHARSALAAEPSFLFVRRLVTRPSGAFEDHDTLSEEAFARGEAEGAFALSWRAHGLGYAVPLAAGIAVDGGAVAVCNLSRAAIDDARRRFPNVLVVCWSPRHAKSSRHGLPPGGGKASTRCSPGWSERRLPNR